MTRKALLALASLVAACSAREDSFGANTCTQQQTFTVADVTLGGASVRVDGTLLDQDCVRLCQPTPLLPADWAVRACRVRARRADTVDLDCTARAPSCS